MERSPATAAADEPGQPNNPSAAVEGLVEELVDYLVHNLTGDEQDDRPERSNAGRMARRRPQ